MINHIILGTGSENNSKSINFYMDMVWYVIHTPQL